MVKGLVGLPFKVKSASKIIERIFCWPEQPRDLPSVALFFLHESLPFVSGLLRFTLAFHFLSCMGGCSPVICRPHYGGGPFFLVCLSLPSSQQLLPTRSFVLSVILGVQRFRPA
jgi:hypothetical protein